MKSSSSGTNKWKNVAIASWAIVGVFIVLWISVIILRQIKVVLPLVLYTTVLVYLLRPAIEKLHQRGVPRGLSVAITYLVVVALVALLFWYFIPVITKQFVSFAGDLTEKYIPVIQKYVGNLQELVNERLGGKYSNINKLFASFSTRAQEIGLNIIKRLPGATFGLFSGLLNLILAPILAFYILKDLPIIKETISDLIPKNYRDEVLTLINKANLVLAGFLKGQLMVSLIVGLLVGIWLWIIQVDSPFVLGMISGLLNIIPYLGPVLGGTIAALVAAVAGGTVSVPVWKIVAVVAGMFSIQQLDSAIISPQIMRRQVNLHPVLIVFALFIGGSLFGIIGMILAIPLLAVAKVMLYHFVSKQDIF